MAAAAAIVVWSVYALVRRVPTHSLLDKVNPRILLALTVLWLAYSAVRIVSLSMGQDYFALVVA